MKKILIYLLSFISVFSMSACGGSSSSPNEEINEIPSEISTGIQPNDVPAGSEADIQVRNVVANFIDTFKSCDFDAIKNIIHEDDQWCFNFESENQLAFYNAIFPQIEYEFEFVSEYEGVYGVMTKITSPDMAEVYGTIITNYIDSTTLGDNNRYNIIAESTDTMIELLKSPDLARREERLYIYVEYIDGKYIPRCDFYLANELTGGAPEVSDGISSSISETIDALG